MEFLSMEVFPDPAMGDPIAGVSGNERMRSLQGAFQNVCDFLQSRDGLLAFPIRPRFDFEIPPSVAHFGVDPSFGLETIGVPGVERVRVFHASDGVAMRTASIGENFLQPTVFHPLMVVSFEVVTEWTAHSKSLPFFGKLAKAFGAKELIYGYGIDMEPGVGRSTI